MQVRATDMMNVLLYVLIAFAVVSIPISYFLERKYGFGKRVKLFHMLCAVVGAVIILADSLLCFKLASSLRTPGVGDWAKDFFFGYLWTMLPIVLVITVLVAVSAAINHSMKRVRIALTALLPVSAVLVTLFVATLASGGEFPVDTYIRWLAPGLGLLSHIVPLCERNKKSD